ncbi:MAG TPA: AraC family transcriptional regulator, partial [Desulfobacteraceae bacterium]|nr:AraC family transcriptional regulator [Desulfobacteraceae bacterium]
MNENNKEQVDMPEKRMAASKALAKSVARWTGDENQVDTDIPGLRLSRWTT